MVQHAFIFVPGKWLGEGSIELNMIEEKLHYFTRWKVGETEGGGIIECSQELQVKGLSDLMVNQFIFSELQGDTFSVLMENHSVGKVEGKGFIRPNMIGWEFRVPALGFEGFEFYEKQEEGLYHVHGEFSTQDDLRTVLHGKIWLQKCPQ